MKTMTATTRDLTFFGAHELRPGPAWQALFRATQAGYRSWYQHEDGRQRPSAAVAQAQLARWMPELVPTWERLCELVGDDSLMCRMLTLWNPPRFLPGCSQAVFGGDRPLLVRNYDYDPDLCERVTTSTRWGERRVLGTSDCLWGLLDGMNDAGLAASLAFGGRAGAGDGFGIPLVVRYLLEVCDTLSDVRRTLARLPVHMAYNVTVLDRNADAATFFVAPGQPAEESPARVATNHRGDVPEDAVHARRFRSVERQRALRELTRSGADREHVVERFLAPPLYSTGWDRAFGTVYTAVYSPTEASLDLHWPGSQWRRTFDSPSGTHRVVLADPAWRAQTPGVSTTPEEFTSQAGPASSPQELGDTARAAIEALAGSDDPAAFHELLALSELAGQGLGQCARNLASAGSWAGVGGYAGLSRQTAWARWGKASAT